MACRQAKQLSVSTEYRGMLDAVNNNGMSALMAACGAGNEIMAFELVIQGKTTHRKYVRMAFELATQGNINNNGNANRNNKGSINVTTYHHG